MRVVSCLHMLDAMSAIRSPIGRRSVRLASYYVVYVYKKVYRQRKCNLILFCEVWGVAPFQVVRPRAVQLPVAQFRHAACGTCSQRCMLRTLLRKGQLSYGPQGSQQGLSRGIAATANRPALKAPEHHRTPLLNSAPPYATDSACTRLPRDFFARWLPTEPASVSIGVAWRSHAARGRPLFARVERECRSIQLRRTLTARLSTHAAHAAMSYLSEHDTAVACCRHFEIMFEKPPSPYQILEMPLCRLRPTVLNRFSLVSLRACTVSTPVSGTARVENRPMY